MCWALVPILNGPEGPVFQEAQALYYAGRTSQRLHFHFCDNGDWLLSSAFVSSYTFR